MPINHTVRAGDCISSIAFQHGFFPDTIWNHADNSGLKTQRKDPNVLRPGDAVVVPEKVKKQIDKPDAAKHRFKRKGVPDVLRLQVLDEKGRGLANREYTLDIDGQQIKGTTDGDGVVEQPVPPNARSGKLTLADWPVEYTLNLGHLSPADTPDGAKMRLANLGYDVGSTDGDFDEKSTLALERFQGEQALQVSGGLDDATIDKLKEVHGS